MLKPSCLVKPCVPITPSHVGHDGYVLYFPVDQRKRKPRVQEPEGIFPTSLSSVTSSKTYPHHPVQVRWPSRAVWQGWLCWALWLPVLKPSSWVLGSRRCPRPGVNSQEHCWLSLSGFISSPTAQPSHYSVSQWLEPHIHTGLYVQRHKPKRPGNGSWAA